MTSWKKPTAEIIDRTLATAKKETDRQYFFSRLKNPLWFGPLAERGYFATPPKSIRLPDGSEQYPFWPELEYLKNVVNHVPDEVADVILGLPDIGNPRVASGILDIALKLPGSQSSRLTARVVDCVRSAPRFLPLKLSELLEHWIAEEEDSAALEFAKELVSFVPDPASEEKQLRRRENRQDWSNLLKPSPAIDSWEYRGILTKAVLSLAERKPLEVACLLMDATVDMIVLRTHSDALELGTDEDYSEIWCPRLDGWDGGTHHDEPEKMLVRALTLACQKVFERAPDQIAELDGRLRNHRWKLFRRIRQHLYTVHPSEVTRPWIREFLLSQENYGKWTHHYEFQRMARRACDFFGEQFFTVAERRGIFDAILAGPPKQIYMDRWGEQFNEEWFANLRSNFHRRQFRAFESVLFGQYSEYFEKLESESEQEIVDDDYLQIGVATGGAVHRRSPRSPQDLSTLSDEEILSFINEWDAEHLYHGKPQEGNYLVEINVEGLAEAFQSYFKDVVVPSETKLGFWLQNRDKIEKPIFVKSIIEAMHECVKGKEFGHLEQFLEFSQWVLLHPDLQPEIGYWKSDQSGQNPNWHSSRRAVGDLVGSCVEEELGFPVAFKCPLARLLETLCKEFDSRLDGDAPFFADGHDHLSEAINNTRSRALESLIKFGVLLRRNDEDADISLVTGVIEERFASDSEIPFTLPERAILGLNYGRVFNLDKEWAVRHKSEFFPQEEFPAWQEAFSIHLRFSHPNLITIDVLKDDFAFALKNLTAFPIQSNSRDTFTDILGQHLFTYYLWGVYPLKGPHSLLEQFYHRTDRTSEYWGNLFDHIGFTLRNTGRHLDVELKERLVAFFDWRLEEGEARELTRFSLWFESECLDPEWRLEAYSKILDVGQPEGMGIYGQVETLTELLPNHGARVVKCFAKLTDHLGNDTFHIMTEPAKKILTAGLGSSEATVRANAERARENLLRKGRFDLIDMDD